MGEDAVGAWMPVISSVLITCVPAAASAEVISYTSQTEQICSVTAAGSSAGGVSQYRLRCGCNALTF
jgi:hypothetical protein